MIERQRHSIRAISLIAVTAFFVTFAWAAFAQTPTTGAISGIVKDTTGAAISGATVEVVNQAMGVSRTVSTDGQGFYDAESIVSGTYTVTVTAPGFTRSITRDFHVEPGQRRANNVSLEVGAASSQVTVTADAVQINTETSESSGTVTARQIDNLMLNGRNFQTLAIMIPGVVSTSGADEVGGGGTLAGATLIVNGQSSEYNAYFVDGVMMGQIGSINSYPIVDGITEMRVLKDNYSARYGQSSDADFLIDTKSGANTFNGSAWDYLRNDAFDADNYFSTSKQGLHQNIFGYTLGGPVIIPKLYNTHRNKKTFFFAANQWYIVHQASTIRSAVFPQAMRTGDFSASPTLSGNLALDANSKALLASEGKTNCVTGAKTLNQNCFDPAALFLMNKYWPLPNNTAGGFLNYINQASSNTSQQDYQYRVDQTLGWNTTLVARAIYMYVDQFVPQVTTGAKNLMGTMTQDSISSGFDGLVRFTTSFTPAFINTLSFATNTTKVRDNPHNYVLPSDVKIIQAFPGADPWNRVPDVQISKSWAGNGVGTQPVAASGNQGTVAEDVSWVKGSHVIQLGAQYLFGLKRQTSVASPQGSFTFTGTHSGDPVADFLLGLDSSYSQASSDRDADLHNRQGEAYVQDDWRATSRLSLNLGVRWFYFSSSTASGNQITSFNPALFDPAQAPVVKVNGSLVVNSSNVPLTSAGQPANLLNGIIFAGQNGIPSGFFIPGKRNFAPRIGFAYDLTGNGKTAIRGGYGMGYSNYPLGRVFSAFGTNPPFNNTANILNSLLSNGTAGTTAAPTPQTLQLPESTSSPAQSQSYSLTVERQINPHMVATIAYVGNVGRHLENYVNQNAPLPVTAPSTTGCLAAGQAASASYDFDPCINPSKASGSYTVPYKGYGGITGTYEEGASNYNSFQSGLIYRAGDSQMNVAYTYSKSLSTIPAEGAGQGHSIGTSGPQNPRNIAAEYGPPDFDFQNNLVGTWVYDIPYLRHSRKAISLPFANWNFAGLAAFQSGFALTPGLATGKNGSATRPNQVAPLHNPHSMNEWFSTDTFSAPGYGFYGSASNGSIRGPHYLSANVAVYKTIPLGDRLKMQFRAEAFNVANHPNFQGVTTTYGSANYGQVTSARSPREMEFAFKLTF